MVQIPMMRPWMTAACRPILPIALLLIAGIPFSIHDACGQDEPDSASDSNPKPVKIAGTFEAIRQFEVSADNEHLTALKIERVLPFGSKVTKAQGLIWFETQSLDDKLRTAETDLQLAKLDLESDEFAHQQFLKQQTLDKAKAKRTRDIAQQEYDNYQKVDRERQIKQAKFSLEASEFSLESATEEFRQLEQMYKEDDLTEESEEIVLRRAKRAMKTAAFALERAKIQFERTTQQTVPRGDASQEESLARAMLEYEKSMRTMAIDKQTRELKLQQSRDKLEDQAETLQELRAERKKVVLKSDIDGIFLYGKLTRSKLPAKPVELSKGGTVSGSQIIGTVVDPTRLQIRVDLPEERYSLVRKGVGCKVVPKGMPNVRLDGQVKSVSLVPYTNGKYDCVVTLRGSEVDELVPTMTCDLLFDDPDAALAAQESTDAGASDTETASKADKKKSE
jgi:hypothetical protein